MKNLLTNKNHRVVITGLGVVSSLGIGWREFWKNLITGSSGIDQITSFDTSRYDNHYAGEIKNFDPNKFINKRKINHIGRTSQMAIAATKLALKDSNFHLDKSLRNRIGVCIGTTMGEPQVMEKFDDPYFWERKLDIDFLSVLAYSPTAISTNVAHSLKLCGRNFVFSNACSSGNYAISYSFDLIRSGEQDFMFAGGADAFSRVALSGFSRLIAMAPQRCQPFDKNRMGMLIGEGAGIVFLETLESAKKRNAKIYAEVLGYGLSSDASHMTNPSVKGISKAIKKSLVNSAIHINEVDYINAHGTGTYENDKAECQAIYQVFGKDTKNIPVSSIKSMLGHTMGAASALESIACCLVIDKSEIPPTINFEEKDPDCDIDCVPNKGRTHQVKIALNNSQAFGGNNVCLVFKKFTSVKII